MKRTDLALLNKQYPVGWQDELAEKVAHPEVLEFQAREDESGYVLVELAEKIYGIPVEIILRVRKAEQVSRLPHCESEVLSGLTVLDGRIVPAVDLARGISGESQKKFFWEIFLKSEEGYVALLVEHVLKLEKIPDKEISKSLEEENRMFSGKWQSEDEKQIGLLSAEWFVGHLMTMVKGGRSGELVK